jgi:hypothetical protein
MREIMMNCSEQALFECSLLIRAMAATVLVAGLIAFADVHACAQSLSSAELNAVLKDPSVKISATLTTVVGTGPALTVLAEEAAKTADQDLKIDAIFLTKALIDSAPNQISTVKVLFSQAGKPGRFIVITKGEISQYGSGKLTANQLLSSIRLLEVGPERAPTVKPGPLYDRRLLAWERINKLKQGGTGVRPFEAIFEESEAAAGAPDADKVDEKLTFLESKLTEQEEQVALIKKAARGLGVPAAPSRTEYAAAPTASGGGNAAAQRDGYNYIPPDGEILKRVYAEKADDVIREVQLKNAEGGKQLRLLKEQIDQCFAGSQQGQGFALMHKFQTYAAQQLGSDPFGPLGGGQPGQQGQQMTNNQTSRSQPTLWGQPHDNSAGGQASGPNGSGPNGGGPNGGSPNGGPNGGGANGGGGFPGGGPPGGGPPGGGF